MLKGQMQTLSVTVVEDCKWRTALLVDCAHQRLLLWQD